MESNRHQQLRDLERAEAAPYIDYPPTPWWYHPAAGLWFAGLTGTKGLTEDHLPAAIGLLVVLLAALGAFSAWYARYRGAMPSLLRRAPKGMGPMFALYFVGVAGVLGAVWWTGETAGWAWASALMFVLATVGLWLHEHSYAAAAARVRERLS
ncbi:hypothetical protein [Nocardioides sp. SYSU DS0663]|uniref:hypothetical protein n=1 Tax=Nocardioides sp. SYSU DS0663 TaxID=3416445 RepID=UPI003F4BA7DE